VLSASDGTLVSSGIYLALPTRRGFVAADSAILKVGQRLAIHGHDGMRVMVHVERLLDPCSAAVQVVEGVDI
jgi:hypothetical protein